MYTVGKNHGKKFVHDKPRGRPRPDMSRLKSFLSKDDLLKLLHQDVPELVKNVSSEIKQFQVTLEKSDICSKHLGLILELLLKVTSGLSNDEDVHFNSITILGEVFNDRCSTFQSQLKIYVAKKILQPYNEKNLVLVCNFFEVLLTKIPGTCWSILPLDELSQSINMLLEMGKVTEENPMRSKLTNLLELRDAITEQQHVKSINKSRPNVAGLKKWDNMEYRTISILPQWNEISTPKPPYRLRPNIVDGEYEDWMHYYDVQFRLLREDFISPLRKGIKDYHDGKVGRNLSNLRLYHGVKIKRAVFTQAGLCHKIHFSVEHMRCNWEHSKRLIFGSLLCLSPDNFQHKVFFATVSNRDARDLARGNLEVMFQEGAEVITHQKLGTQFVMVESIAFFEASRHILRSLQTAENSTMPFTKYLIKNDSKDISPPKYLGPGTTYDMSLIVNAQILSRPRLALKFSHVDIRESQQWPPLEDTQLDESQLKAMRMALSQEIAVLQGPPGTGKTYIGLKIVQALLKNVSAGHKQLQSPILVMCFTNHALDQFLEGIMDLNKDEKLNLIRIGGRSKNENIQKCNLNTVKRTLKNVPKQEHENMRRLAGVAENVGANCRYHLDIYQDPVHDFISFTDIEHVISKHHLRSLRDPAESVEERPLALEIWLGLYIKKVHEEIVPVEFTDDNLVTSSDDDDSEDSESEYETASSNFDEESEDETDNSQEGEDTVKVDGEGNREQDARLIEDMEEMFEELTFDGLPVEEIKKKRMKTHNIRRIVKIEKCQEYIKFMNYKMQNLTVTTINEFDAEEIEDVNQLSLEERWELYKYWHSKYRAHLLKDLEEECQKYNTACEDANAAKRENERYALETAHVIGMTTTGAAKYQHVLHLLKPRIVIVEEAAEVLESHIVSALNAGTQHLILIGDHKQLRPKPNEYDLAVKYKLDISLFERLVKNDFPHVTLQIQHRMRPEIAELVKPHIYDTLHNHDSVQNYPKVKGVSSNMFLICHNEPEKPSSDLSHSNQHEAQYLVALCKYLLQQGYEPSQITILVTYTGQLLLMKNLMPRSEFEGVRICTVDSYQGEENDIILLSLVRSNKEGSIGFLREENRVCVSLSRAKHGFYCIGNFEMLRRNASIWQKIVSDMESKGRVGNGLNIHCTNHPDNSYVAKLPDDFAKNSPKGGCNLDCGTRLKCGHTCPQKCHISDPEHLKFICKKPCGRECPQGHICSSLCYIKCLCMRWVEKDLPNCDHKQKMFCHQDPNDASCMYVVDKIIPLCEHSQEMFCYQDPQRFQCKVMVQKTILKCGHTQSMFCHQNANGVKCQTVVAKVLRCGHTQEMPCHQHTYHVHCNSPCEKPCPKGHPCQQICHINTPCRPCKTDVVVTMTNCGHEQHVLCHQDPAETKCLAKCGKSCIKHSHPCPLKCHQGCQDCKVMTDIIPKCGHSAPVRCSEADKYVCTRMVDKILTCGHTTFIRCSKDVNGIVCRSMVDVSLRKCKHTHSVQCSTNINSINCNTLVNVSLSCGHSASVQCSVNVNSIKCLQLCRRFLKCGHGKMLSCYEDPSSVTCTKPSIKPLDCGHTVKVACFEKPSSANCVEQCLKPLPCGHSVTTECNKDPNSIICKTPCTNILKCGHKCQDICGIQCACSEIVKVNLPSCGHSVHVLCTQTNHLSDVMCTHFCKKKLLCSHKCKNKCGESCTEACMEYVMSKCNQGHEQTVRCFQKYNSGPCKRKCEKILECGHPCKKMCFEQCTTRCKFLVIKKYPCGHRHKIPCYIPIEEMPCDLICRSVLACGHYCEGKCSVCFLTRIHKPCTSTVGMKHFCGEKTRMPCLGLKNKHSHSSKDKHLGQVIECKHKKIPWNCSNPLLPCHEACGWACPPQCPHPKKCSKLCFEQCDRIPCNERCTKFLACGHRCVGLCGEPCISLCPDCDPEQFSSQHKQAIPFSTNERYVQLPCGHIFTAMVMDKHICRTPDSEVCLLQCPICSCPLSCSFRYGNPMKESLGHVEAVRELVKVKHRDKKGNLIQMCSNAYKRKSMSQYERCTPTLFHCLSIVMTKLRETQPSQEEEFLLFIVVKLFDFVTRGPPLGKICTIIEELSRWIRSNLSDAKHIKLSYQVINDLLSEYYRLSLEVKVSVLEQLADTSEHGSFLTKLDTDCRLRISRKEFVHHSKLLDQKCPTSYKSTEEVIVEVELFQPMIKNGLWRKCGHGHYYCVPVSRPQCLEVQCSECTGTYSGSIEICDPKDIQPVYIDIAPQREKVIKEGAAWVQRLETARAQGGASATQEKKKRRKKRKPRRKQ